MDVLKNLIYGFVSGIAEFLPVSSGAHQGLIRYIFGIDARDSLQNLLVHIGVLFAVILGFRETLFRLQREQKSLASGRRRSKSLDIKAAYDLKLIKTAAIPLFIGLFLSFATWHWENSLLAIMAFFLLNALVLLVADHAPQGNKDARTLTGLDGILIGILGALSALPGVSRTGMISSYTTLRGADRERSASWAIVLCIPAMIFAIIFDFYGMFSFGVGSLTFIGFLGYLVSGISAFFGGYLGISLLQTILVHSGFSGFAYYSLGASFLSFMLYLIT